MNDSIGIVKFLVGCWLLIGLAAVYSREINDKVLTLSASGWTYQSIFILYDYETGSLWYPISAWNGLTCINGEFANQSLHEIPSKVVEWNTCKAENPHTKFLKY